MRTRSKKESAKIAPEFGGSYMNDKHNLHPFPSEFEELETTIKVENYNERNEDLLANIVKSEFVEFHSNQTEESFSQKDMKTVLLKKIPTTETEILGDDDEPPPSSHEVDDPFNNDAFRDSDLNSDPDLDPKLDPFADVDCDPSFSRHPPSYNSNDSATTQVQLINAAGVKASLNPSSSAKSTLPTATTSLQNDRMRVTEDSKFRCQLCLELRYPKTWLKTHLETCAAYHKNRHRFCVPCNTLFCTIEGYRQHSLHIHGIQVPKLKDCLFKCQFCPCFFARRDQLVAHLASHPEINTIDKEDLKRRPYRCQECPSAFRHHSVYMLHMRTHKTERPFKCPMLNCGKAFKTKGILKTHFQICSSGDKSFKCPEPICRSTFKTKIQLQKHVACHSEERPFKCYHSDCRKTFPRKDRLKEHLALHAEARRTWQKKSFKCPEFGCFGAFTQAHSLKRHINQKHQK